jgi:hypothetical protein
MQDPDGLRIAPAWRPIARVLPRAWSARG